MKTVILSLLLSLQIFVTGADDMLKATFAAGCFWGVEAAFRNVDGVTATRVGYTGGKVENVTYEEVCTGLTGHAEAVEVEFDSLKVTYEELLEVFFKVHDPTTLNRQGPDFGTQYRSGIYYHDERQKESAEKFIRELGQSERFRDSVVTEVTKFNVFYPAEEYHQQYLAKRGQASCGVTLKKEDD